MGQINDERRSFAGTWNDVIKDLRTKIYFLSDVHLGSKMHADSIDVERKLCSWFDMVRPDARVIYLLGDIFDYWFEYRRAVPKGFTRVLGKMAELTDNGTEIHFFIGNHDIWLTDYLAKECGLILHLEPLITEHYNKKFYLAHGDGLGDKSKSLYIMRRIFHSPILRKAFAFLHPDWTIPLAHKWSNTSREKGETPDFLGEEREYQIQFAKEQLKLTPDIDYFIFGHRHIMLDIPIQPHSHVVILGDWIKYFSYAVFDENGIHLKQFETASKQGTIMKPENYWKGTEKISSTL